MTEQYIESSCGLINGARFEELIVNSFYTDGTPKIYKVVCAYSANPYANSGKSEDRIYFNGRDGNCYWWKDSTSNGVYKNFGVGRELFDELNAPSQDSIVLIKTYVTKDSMVIKGGKPPRNSNLYPGVQMKCPLRFKTNTWYYVDFHDQRYEAYLYVDVNKVYNLFKISKPTNF